MDWASWHDKYDDLASPLAHRLRTVQTQVRTILDESPPGPLRVISICAGQGRDLLDVLVDHPRRNDVQARLVELDIRNTALAEERARAAGLSGVEVVTADASFSDHYRGMAPADLVLICGLFGNIVDDDIEKTIDCCRQLCRTGGAVIWTRNRRTPDRVPLICKWFGDRGFDRQWLSEPEAAFAVGVHRFAGNPPPLELGTRMFKFVGYEVLNRQAAPPPVALGN
ncbi:class I SAM-dependent methyltransferase family protein [Tabrizicola sp.]|uniref:class I SAM-dependent methyltransferase family protein n=1 Tax=Tabrizicola sp. TaxID=2005166 RepID=UPI003F40254B